MPTTQPAPYQILNAELAKGDQVEAAKNTTEPPLYTFKFKAPSGRWFEVKASDLTIQELLIPCKQNRFSPLLKGLQSIVPKPLPPCLAARPEPQRGAVESYPEAA